MSKFTSIYRDATRSNHGEENILDLLVDYGNKLFDSHPSDWSDIVQSARFLRDCANSGPVFDIGAGEGAAALLLARLLDCPVVAVEIVAERAERIAERARRFDLANLSVRCEDALATDLSEVAGFYVFTPFFDADSARFIDRVERMCRPGTRICGIGLIAGQLRAGARMREPGSGPHRFGHAQLVLV